MTKATPVKIDGEVMHADATQKWSSGSAHLGLAARPDVVVSWLVGVSGRGVLVSNLFPEPPPEIFRGPRGNAEIMSIAQVVVQSPEQVETLSTELLSSQI
jgi:hypothetical protein